MFLPSKIFSDWLSLYNRSDCWGPSTIYPFPQNMEWWDLGHKILVNSLKNLLLRSAIAQVLSAERFSCLFQVEGFLELISLWSLNRILCYIDLVFSTGHQTHNFTCAKYLSVQYYWKKKEPEFGIKKEWSSNNEQPKTNVCKAVPGVEKVLRYICSYDIIIMTLYYAYTT